MTLPCNPPNSGQSTDPVPEVRTVSFPRGAAAGSTIALRARFIDDLGTPTQAGDVYVHIFPPSATDTDDLNNAEVVSGVATYLGSGIFEYSFTVPADAEDGTWHDKWEGDLTYQALDEVFDFEITASGIIEAIPNQLYNNNIVHVILASGIQSTDGSALTEPVEFEFLTTTNPSYTSVRKVRLEVGGFIPNVFDDTVQLAILEASLEADQVTWEGYINSNTARFVNARRQYTTCLASKILLTNMTSKHMLKSKTLGDLSVTYDPGALINALNQLDQCLAKWEPVLEVGASTARANPQMVVKGELDPDRPIVTRMWATTETGEISRRIPAANNEVLPSGRRRAIRMYWPRRTKW